jgi:hypothetical protein
MAPMLPGGPFPEQFQTWSYQHSQTLIAIAAGQTVMATIPASAKSDREPLKPKPPGIGGGPPVMPPIQEKIGPGGAYPYEREARIAYQMAWSFVNGG